MPYFDYKCPNCNKQFSELVKNCEQKVYCPNCKSLAERNYSGTILGGLGKKTATCTGDCKHCSGCK